MKKKIFCSIALCLLLSMLGGCSNSKTPANYTVNTDGDLIVTYTDGTTDDLGKLGDSLVNGVNTVTVSDDGYYVINGIKTNIVAVDTYTVSFDTGFSGTVPSQLIKRGDKVVRPEISREGYTFDTWKCNGEEWHFNSDVVLNNMSLIASWTANTYNVTFSTEYESIPKSTQITYDSSYTLPTLSHTGYTFGGWYYKGSKVNSSLWNIASDCTLNAKWNVNKYVVSLNANGGNVSIKDVEVTYGQNYTLPIPTNYFGSFRGWYYGDTKLTSETGASLVPWTYTKNITATTEWIAKISTAEQLSKIRDEPNGIFELTNDIDISGSEWIPIGNPDHPFFGVLNGNGFKISGLTITQPQSNIFSYGLFGAIGNLSKIYNLNLSNVNIDLSGVPSNSYAGAIAGSEKIDNDKVRVHASIDSCNVYGKVSFLKHSGTIQSYAGGFIGSGSPIITNSNNYANVSALSYAGGFSGSYWSKESINNTNYGVIQNAQYAGGIVGDSQNTIVQCRNKGAITGVQFVGGIAGAGACSFCSNYGSISAKSEAGYAGGISGGNGAIENSYNTGDVSSNYIGGGIGCYLPGTIISCYNTGLIKSSNTSGGIVPYGAKIADCVNFGNVQGGLTSFSIANTNMNLSIINNCFYGSSVSAKEYQGTLTSETYSEDFYLNSLFWSKFDSGTSTGYWVFHQNAYPTLWWEK